MGVDEPLILSSRSPRFTWCSGRSLADTGWLALGRTVRGSSLPTRAAFSERVTAPEIIIKPPPFFSSITQRSSGTPKAVCDETAALALMKKWLTWEVQHGGKNRLQQLARRRVR